MTNDEADGLEKNAEQTPDAPQIKPQLITLCTRHGEILEEHGITISKIELGVIDINKKLDRVLLGDEEKPGIISRIVNLENFRIVLVRIFWIAGTVVITSAVSWTLVWAKVIH